MNNNDSKKPASHWVNRLYNQLGTTLNVTQGKTYYAHRYHDEKSANNPTPFSTLFSGLGNAEPKKDVENTDYQRFNGQGAILPKASLTIEKNGLSCNTRKLIVPNDRLNLASHADLHTQFIVRNCYRETPDTKTYRLLCLDGQGFDYLPGQYITLSILVDGKAYKRSYSLASPPSRPGIIEITVKRDPNGGVVSNWLNDQLKVGDILNVKGPFGKFSCAPKPPQKILFLAAGSGIVPIMSMLRWLADTESLVDISAILSFRTSRDIIYRDELNLIAARHNNIKLFITLTKEPPNNIQCRGFSGRVDRNRIAALVPDMPERAVYLCGPDAFMASCKNHLHGLQLPAGQLFYESFTVNSPASASHEASISEHSIAQTAPIRRSPNKTGNYRIKFAKSAIAVVTDGSKTLLEIAESAGITLDHECRAGSCGECMVKCLEGGILMAVQAEIDERDRKNGWVYACCAYPASDTVLDI